MIELRLFLHTRIRDRYWYDPLDMPQSPDSNDGLVGTMVHYIFSRSLALSLEQLIHS
jgi:hypothetical protein